jgi:spore coat polysaccharide biosynthesis protein SpsF (cytidylyltransferase family)
LEWIIAQRYKELATNAHADEVEHVTKHLYRKDAVINMVSIVQDGIDQSNSRLTVDYPADLLLLNELVKKISKDPIDLTYTDILRFLNES